jgi:hypothetical protein
MDTSQQKAFCVVQFTKTNSAILVQRMFRRRFGIDPPIRCNDLLLRTCPYAVGLLGRQTSSRATSLWGYVEGTVYRPPLPHDPQELRQRIITAVTAIEEDLLQNVWQELDYRLHVYRVPTLSVCNVFFTFPGVKARPGRDTDHSPPSSAEVENE